jgi:WS/DGAT/MGAT family acyltransferase
MAMHTGGLATFDARPFTRPDGVLEIERIEPVLEEFLVQLPHARQRLRYVPFELQPVWIDDDRFKLAFHVRHTRLPGPGSERQLKRLIGRLMSEPLDRHKPLWEAWVIEGLIGMRVAIMLKVHPGVLVPARLPELLASIGTRTADGLAAPRAAWRPRKAPAPAQMIADSLVHWASEVRAAAKQSRDVILHPVAALREAVRNADAFRLVVSEAITGPRHPVLNPHTVGGHRRVETYHVPLRDMETIADELGGDVVDVALAALGAALERLLAAQGSKIDGGALRVLLSMPEDAAPRERDLSSPVSIRMVLPVAEVAPARRVAAVAQARTEALQSRQVEGFDLLEKVESWTPAVIQKAVTYAAGRRGAANLVVQILGGPREPIPLLDTRVQTITVFAPLFIDQALSVCVVRACGLLSFGLNSDWDLLPNIHELTGNLAAAFDELRAAAAAQGAPTAAAAAPTQKSAESGGEHSAGRDAEPGAQHGAEQGRTA